MTINKTINTIMILFVADVLTECKTSTGLTEEELSAKIEEYGFFQMPEPTNASNHTNKVSDSDISITYAMDYEDFQVYVEDLYDYYYLLEEVKVIGYVERMETMGFFTNLFITISDHLPLETGPNIENNEIKYVFAFSMFDYEDNSSIDGRNIVALSYLPVNSVSGNNMSITLDRSTLTSVYIDNA